MNQQHIHTNRGEAGHQVEAAPLLHRPGQGGQGLPGVTKFLFSKFELKSRKTNLGRWQMDKLRSEKRLQHRPSN